MTERFASILAAVLLASSCTFAQVPGVAEPHIAANVPDTSDFRSFLVRDLTVHLKRTLGEGISVDYELLRDGPTQTGIAYPKFYLWVTATKPDKTVVDGAARVAAIDKKRFEVTDFLTRSEIAAKPDSIARVFPQLLLDKIRNKAGITR
jgi:hypothetical protein